MRYDGSFLCRCISWFIALVVLDVCLTIVLAFSSWEFELLFLPRIYGYSITFRHPTAFLHFHVLVGCIRSLQRHGPWTSL
ncbi:hypothetical protein BT93_J1737 [Corymbia citriodora subsp. variegata]|nr:hypothetical protein BT93_J1737 [Corymbia citriodora subsp. variegata]